MLIEFEVDGVKIVQPLFFIPDPMHLFWRCR